MSSFLIFPSQPFFLRTGFIRTCFLSGLVDSSELAVSTSGSHSRLQMEQTGDGDEDDNDDHVDDDKHNVDVDGDKHDVVDDDKHNVVKVSVQFLRPPWTSEFPLYHECHTPTEIQVLTLPRSSSSKLSLLPLALSFSLSSEKYAAICRDLILWSEPANNVVIYFDHVVTIPLPCTF